MSAQLIEQVAGRERVHELGKEFSIGRGTENDLSLSSDSSVSRHHARLHQAGSAWMIDDLKSQNGTFVERSGTLVRVTKDFELAAGDVICAGAARLAFAETASEEASSGNTTIAFAQGSTVIGRPVPRFLQSEGGEGGNKGRVRAAEVLHAALSPAVAADRVRAVMKLHGLKITADDGTEIVAEQTSQLTAKLAGGLLGSAKSFPKRAVVRIKGDGEATTIDAEIAETLDVDMLDENVRKRYEEDFARWLSALRTALETR
jgi:hypothetical protein